MVLDRPLDTGKPLTVGLAQGNVFPDEKWGERPLMLIVLKPDFKGKVKPEDLKKHMKAGAEEGKLPKYGVPERYELVDEIPKTSVGKLDKKTMRKLFK